MNLKNSTFTIYGKDNCQHCTRAKEFAIANGIEYIYLTLGKNYTKEELIEKLRQQGIPRTVPQIFRETDSSTEYIGGADDFIAFVQKHMKSC